MNESIVILVLVVSLLLTCGSIFIYLLSRCNHEWEQIKYFRFKKTMRGLLGEDVSYIHEYHMKCKKCGKIKTKVLEP